MTGRSRFPVIGYILAAVLGAAAGGIIVASLLGLFQE